MTTKEFISSVKEFDFSMFIENQMISVRTKNGTVASVSEKKIYAMDTRFRIFEDLSDIEKKQLFNLLTEYASTPLKEREDPKLYYLKLKGAKYFSVPNWRYLNKDIKANSYF